MPWPISSPRAVRAGDLALGTALCLAAFVELGTGVGQVGEPGAPPVNGWHWLVAAGTTLPLAVRGPAPVVTGLGIQVGAVVSSLLNPPAETLAGGVSIFVVATYTAALGARSLRASVAAGLASLLLVSLYGVTDPRYEAVGSAVANALWVGLVWCVAATVRRTRETGERLAAARAELAVEAERRRVTRDMHDLVAHGLSVVVLRARGAVHDLAGGPAGAEEALRDVDRVASRALADMRRLLAATAEEGRDDGPPVVTPPQPGLAQLEDLLADVRGAGLPVELRTTGEPRPLTAGAELAVFRLVQESLTNVVRHGHARHAQVCLRWRADGLTVEVVDDGRGAAAEASTGGGRGLLGMRERVEILGGRFEAGPAATGGFRTHAVIPVGAL